MRTAPVFKVSTPMSNSLTIRWGCRTNDRIWSPADVGLGRAKKPGETEPLPAFLRSWIAERLRSVPLELVDFVLDA